MDYDDIVVNSSYISNSIDQIYDFEIIGDECISVLIKRKSPEGFKKKLMAAIKAERLGLNSLDSIMKRFSKDWILEEYETEAYIAFIELLDFIREKIDIYIGILCKLNMINTVGLIIARSALYRLQNTFNSIFMLISRGFNLEAINLSRVILEQCAWCYCIYDNNSIEEILKTKPTDCIRKFKEFYIISGNLNGFLSKNVHITPSLIHLYMKINKNNHVITLNPKEYKNDSLYSLSQITDMYCCTIEYCFNPFITDFSFLKLEKDKFIVDENRNFIKDVNKLLDDYYKYEE
jgi:hypothetical protein